MSFLRLLGLAAIGARIMLAKDQEEARKKARSKINQLQGFYQPESDPGPPPQWGKDKHRNAKS